MAYGSGGTWSRVTDPVLEPVSLAEAKLQARITDENSDELVALYLRTAREEAENTLGFGVLTQTWRYDLWEWFDVVPLPMARVLQSVGSVKYYDATGVLQTLPTTYYQTDSQASPCALVRAPQVVWPALQSDRKTGRIQITYVVGWATPADVPERIKQGIRLWVTFLDVDRDGQEDASAINARRAAQRCWSDKLYFLEPSCA